MSCEPPIPKPQRFRLIACEILFRELCLLASRSRNVIDIDFVRKGLHGLPTDRMVADLQKRIDATDPEVYEAILLGYARCNDGVVGLQARDIPLVIPRAHDCITLFIGSRQRYRQYFDKHPGAYFRTSGWLERDFAAEDGIMNQLGLDRTYEQYVEKYGQEHAEMIMQFVGSWKKHYDRITFIETGVAGDLEYEQVARQEAKDKGWQFDKLTGDLGLLVKMLDGDWPEDEFVVVQPGQKITARNDELVLDCQQHTSGGS